MLYIEKCSLVFGRPVLNDLSLTLNEGEIVGIVGKSGAGKTSLLKTMAGLLVPTSGNVFFEGNKMYGPAQQLVPGHPEIQLVNQDFHLDTYHTTEENIRGQILYLPKKERDDLVEELLHLLELDALRFQAACTLSGGEQQRLSIARALAREPKVLLLDEPFSHLDGRLRNKLIVYLLKLQKTRNMSLVLVSHDGAEVLGLSDRIYLLKKGTIVRVGKPRDFYYKPKTLEDAKLFGPVNSVRIGEKRFFFRPDEYVLDGNEMDAGLSVCFQQSLFTGPVYDNYFLTDSGEQVLLKSFNSLHDVKSIWIRKKY